MALLALTLQLGLAFGHVHAAPAAIAALNATASPPTDTGDSGDTDYCATCAILALLTGAQTATAPVIVLPVAVVPAEITRAPDPVRIVAPQASFRSRAPPLS